MIRDPEISSLRADLERLGNVVAPHRDHLCVRLPLFASVRVRIDDQGRLDCEPMFGPLNRTHAVQLSTTLLTLTTGALFYFTGASPLALFVGLLGIMSGLASVWRFILTENCVTRIQMLWAMRKQRDEGVLFSASIPAVRGVEVPSADLTPPHLIKVEQRY
jgi:hypothetical protein